ncbi:MAG: glycosyltransferase family 4 protein [Bifidobacteriaceae bacterium]|jgi:phosphatidylinositol alpha-mannosyltransferase|nr:glycosyltransferase family 4 protein [Bifidobacteriaceae bacterium]
MRIGLVCPYSFDVPGGVQFHIRDLAGELIERGHEVSVLAPAEEDTPLPAYVVAAGRSLPIHYNGSVARLSFGPLAARRTRRWLGDGEFDLLHIHEPIAPSLGMLAMLNAHGPLVATFHSSQTASRALRAAYPLVRASMEKIVGAIAVSEDARRTVMDHLGVDSVIIPNGVHAGYFANAEPDPRWQATPDRPVVAFLGRLDEPRKGLKVALAAVPLVQAAFPGVRFVVAGAGDAAEALGHLGPERAAVELAGSITDSEKAGLFKGCSVYIAPQLGGESFGIVLVEAMAAGAPVVASNLPAFARVLDGGELGHLFTLGDAGALADGIVGALNGSDQTKRQVEAASRAVLRYDWSQVTESILAVYDTVTGR